MSDEKRAYNIFIVSDGSGRTAEQALSAALIQFSDVKVKLIKSYCSSTARAGAIKIFRNSSWLSFYGR